MGNLNCGGSVNNIARKMLGSDEIFSGVTSYVIQQYDVIF